MTNLPVVLNGVCFCEKISEVVDTWFPFNKKVSLFNTIANPAEAHVDGSRAFWFDSVESESDGALVVAGDQCRRLWIAELRESDAKWLGFLSDCEESCVFCFSSRGDNGVEDGAELFNGGIDEVAVVVVAEE